VHLDMKFFHFCFISNFLRKELKKELRKEKTRGQSMVVVVVVVCVCVCGGGGGGVDNRVARSRDVRCAPLHLFLEVRATASTVEAVCLLC